LSYRPWRWAKLAKVKEGDVVGEICLLTGGKRSASVAASMSRKAPPKLQAIEVPKQALRAVIERRPTVIDAFAHSIARRWIGDQVNAVGMSAEVRALQEIRLAHRITESAVSHFKGGKALWAKAGGNVKATIQRMGLTSKITMGGIGALIAAAKGVAGRNVAISDEDAAAVLTRALLLRTLMPAEIRAIVAHGVRRVHSLAGELLIRQGSAGGSMYVVLSGSFEVLVKESAGSGTPAVVGRFLPGEAFGEMSLLTGARRTASIRAAEDSWVLEVIRKGVEGVIRERPLLVDDFAAFIADRQRDAHSVDRTFAEDDDEMSLMGAEQHQQLIEAVQAWVLRGVKSEAAEDDNKEEGVMRVGRRRLAFGETSRKVLDILLKVDVFAALEKTQIIIMLREGAYLETHPPGSEVVTQGDEGRSMYVLLEGEVDVNLEKVKEGGGDAGKSQRTSLRVLKRGDIFGELCLLTGAPRSATVTATYQGATLVQLNTAALLPIMCNVKAFIPTAAAVLAGRYLDKAHGWGNLDEGERDERLALRAGRLAVSIRNFHGMPPEGEQDGRVTARVIVSGVGLVRGGGGGGDQDPSDDPFPGGFGFGNNNDQNKSSDTVSRMPATPFKGTGGWGGGNGNGGEEGGEEGGFAAFDDDVVTGLRLHSVFSTFTRAEMNAVQRRSHRFNVAMGQRVFRQGDEGASIFIVVKGVAVVFYEDHLGRRTKVDELTAGQTVGEMSMLRGEPRAATVIASPPGMEVIEIGRDALDGVLRGRPMLEDTIDDLMRQRMLERRDHALT